MPRRPDARTRPLEPIDWALHLGSCPPGAGRAGDIPRLVILFSSACTYACFAKGISAKIPRRAP
eukprot:5562568-Alexandrium_andersonii.AAC.1